MQKIFHYKDQEIRYELKKSWRARHLRITIYPDAKVSLTVPELMPSMLAEKFLRNKAEWILQKINHFQKRPKLIKPTIPAGSYRDYKEQAEVLIKSLLKKYNQYYGFHFNRISIKNTKTRWGSCSRRKNLNFNYRLVFLPTEMAAYVVVHELCHLQELNHSIRFWALVAKTFPDYKTLRKQFRQI